MGRFVCLPYLAGIVDGEGSILLIHNRARSNRVPYRQLWVAVGNSNLGVLRMLQRTFGGAVGRDTAQQNPFWHWRVTGPTAVACLRALLPYLFIKRRQAELALKHEATRLPMKGYRRVSAAVARRRERIAQALVDVRG